MTYAVAMEANDETYVYTIYAIDDNLDIVEMREFTFSEVRDVLPANSIMSATHGLALVLSHAEELLAHETE